MKCNKDDEYRAPTRLRTSIPKQSWYTLRYVRARNFSTNSILEAGAKAAQNFNILRRLEDDCNKILVRNIENQVGLIQSKATMWVQGPTEANDADSNMNNTHNPNVAVLLLDPSIIEGNPLWLKTRNWTQPPEMGSYRPSDLEEVPEDNSFENFVYWAKKPEAFNFLSTHSGLDFSRIPTQMLFHIICNQWLTLVDYLNTRLNSILWEISFPDYVTEPDVAMAERHRKLVMWHHLLPTFREMIQDMGSLQYMSIDPPNDQGICNLECNSGIDLKGGMRGCHYCMHEWTNPYQLDISKLCDRMAEFGDQVDRLVKLNKVDGSVKLSQDRSDIHRPMASIFWLTILWILGPVLAHVLTVTTHPVSELVPSLRIWAAVAVPIMFILMLGLRLYTA